VQDPSQAEIIPICPAYEVMASVHSAQVDDTLVEAKAQMAEARESNDSPILPSDEDWHCDCLVSGRCNTDLICVESLLATLLSSPKSLHDLVELIEFLAIGAGPSDHTLKVSSEHIALTTDRSCHPLQLVQMLLRVDTKVFDVPRRGEDRIGNSRDQLDRLPIPPPAFTIEPINDGPRSGSWPSALLVLPGAPERLFALFARRGIFSEAIISDSDTTKVFAGKR